MANLVNIPGFNVSVQYSRKEVAEAVATKVSNLAYKASYALTDKALGDSEKVVEAGNTVKVETAKAAIIAKDQVIAVLKVAQVQTEATIDDAIAEAKTTSARVAVATGQKLENQFNQKIGTPVAEQYAKVRTRQMDVHDQIRAKINEYCDGPTLQINASLVHALPEATQPTVEKPKLTKQARKQRELGAVIVEEMAQ